MQSAPEEKTHGCVGWKATSSTPRSRVGTWPLSTFTGTSSGFCSKSLWGRGGQGPGLSTRGMAHRWGQGQEAGEGQPYSLVHSPVTDDDTAIV